VERDLIRTRTAEGRSRAQKRGQRMGRKPKLTEEQQKEARKRRAQGATLAELAPLRRGEKYDFEAVAVNQNWRPTSASAGPTSRRQFLP
jgi:DNA invertase Pin-like site-specific DNA recombinase